jgi:hypothetical protein
MATVSKSRRPRVIPSYLAALDERLGPDEAMTRAELLMGALLAVDTSGLNDDEFTEAIWWSPERPNDDGEIPTSFRVSGFTDPPETIRECIRGLADLLRKRADQLDSLIGGAK